MEINKVASAGTMESSDIMITVSPSTSGNIKINLESSVEKQFGAQIRQVIETTFKNLQVSSAEVTAVDKGALDCTVQARTIAAIYRAADQEFTGWKELASWNA